MGIRCAVVYHAWAAYAFSAGIRCQHCKKIDINTLIQFQWHCYLFCIPWLCHTANGYHGNCGDCEVDHGEVKVVHLG